MKIHGIFDGDGVLFDTAFQTAAIASAIAAEKGCAVPPEEGFRAEYAGHGAREKFVAMGKSRGVVFPEADLAWMAREHEDRKGRIYETNIAPVSGIRAALESLKGVLLSVGSSNPSARSALGLKKTGMEAYFGGRVYGPDKTPSGLLKPAPDIFAQAMKEQGPGPKNTFIVDDMNSGIVAARRTAEVFGEKPLVVGYLDPRLGPDDDARVREMRESFLRDGADIVVRIFDGDFFRLLPFAA